MMLAMAIMMAAATGDKGDDCSVHWQKLDLNSILLGSQIFVKRCSQEIIISSCNSLFIHVLVAAYS